jgi:hypothetical protein
MPQITRQRNAAEQRRLPELGAFFCEGVQRNQQQRRSFLAVVRNAGRDTMTIALIPVGKNDPRLQQDMAAHYSQPKGFVGRQIFYRIEIYGKSCGTIAWGSATRHLPGRKIIGNLLHGMNNLFYHIERPDAGYPLRNCTSHILLLSEIEARKDYFHKYGNQVTWLEALVEIPRTGDLYRKAFYTQVGVTKGFTCKRVSGKGTDNWSGKRVWDTENLRPKIVFYKAVK